jgi:hypothetical protein
VVEQLAKLITYWNTYRYNLFSLIIFSGKDTQVHSKKAWNSKQQEQLYSCGGCGIKAAEDELNYHTAGGAGLCDSCQEAAIKVEMRLAADKKLRALKRTAAGLGIIGVCIIFFS